MKVVESFLLAKEQAMMLDTPQMFRYGSDLGIVRYRGDNSYVEYIGSVSGLPDLTDDAIEDEEEPIALVMQQPFFQAHLELFMWGLIGANATLFAYVLYWFLRR